MICGLLTIEEVICVLLNELDRATSLFENEAEVVATAIFVTVKDELNGAIEALKACNEPDTIIRLELTGITEELFVFTTVVRATTVVVNDELVAVALVENELDSVPSLVEKDADETTKEDDTAVSDVLVATFVTVNEELNGAIDALRACNEPEKIIKLELTGINDELFVLTVEVKATIVVVKDELSGAIDALRD